MHAELDIARTSGTLSETAVRFSTKLAGAATANCVGQTGQTAAAAAPAVRAACISLDNTRA
jgi:hypothetical protein